jgi:hypothetical protein
MTKFSFCLLLVSSLFFTSCKKELQPQESSNDTTAVAASSTAPAANPATANPTTVTPVPVNQPAQATSVPAQAQMPKTAKGMNPPHGQPGHRCDIAVGAPLNSAPAKPAAPQIVSTPQKTTVTPTIPSTVAAPATPVVTAPGMNPPHGQEGHDCAVAVGAPLPKKE